MKEFIFRTLMLALLPASFAVFEPSSTRGQMICESSYDCPMGMVCVYETMESAYGECRAENEVEDGSIIVDKPSNKPGGGGSTGGGSTGGGSRNECQTNKDCPQGLVCISNGEYLECMPPRETDK